MRQRGHDCLATNSLSLSHALHHRQVFNISSHGLWRAPKVITSTHFTPLTKQTANRPECCPKTNLGVEDAATDFRQQCAGWIAAQNGSRGANIQNRHFLSGENVLSMSDVLMAHFPSDIRPIRTHHSETSQECQQLPNWQKNCKSQFSAEKQTARKSESRPVGWKD